MQIRGFCSIMNVKLMVQDSYQPKNEFTCKAKPPQRLPSLGGFACWKSLLAFAQAVHPLTDVISGHTRNERRDEVDDKFQDCYPPFCCQCREASTHNIPYFRFVCNIFSWILSSLSRLLTTPASQCIMQSGLNWYILEGPLWPVRSFDWKT